jgi:hypothetical protein
MRRYSRFLLASGTVLAMACSSSTGPKGGGSADLSATINGSSWLGTVDATATRIVAGGSTIISVGGSNAGGGTTLGMAFSGAGPGTYQIGGAGDATNGVIYEGSQQWAANVSGGTGSITVTSISSTAVSGTFQFTAVPVSGTGATGTLLVESGQFNLSF